MANQKKIVGVLGGMGPDATVDFMQKVIACTPAKTDQDHVHMLVDHDPTIPGRQAAILAGGENPGPAIAAMAVRLEKAGADLLVIPCNTAYFYQDYIVAAVHIPLISIIDVTVAACDGYSTVGLLATEACLRSNLYQDALAAASIDIVLPSAAEIAEFTGLIFQIKSGDRSTAVVAAMQTLATALVARGATAIVAGCTEIPLVLDKSMLEVPLLSSTDLLARETVALANQE